MRRLDAKIPILILAMFLFGCATTNSVGVRAKFDDTKVRSVTVFPAYSLAAFGMTRSESEYLTRVYTNAMVEWAESAGLQVVALDELQTNLGDKAKQSIADGYPPTLPLDRAFEPKEVEFIGAEVEMVQKLSELQALPTDAILVGEIVYQTEGRCEEPATEHSERAWVDGERETEDCLISHFQAKLVHIPSGETIWHNRALLERRAAATPETRLRTIRQAVAMTLQGAGGATSVLGSNPTQPVATRP